VLDDEGELKEIIGVGRDITERKQAEEEKKYLTAQLYQAQKMEAIGTLAGGIAHDFNNILGAVLGYAEMAKDGSPPGSEVSKDLDRVLEASHRAAALVKQILAFSRQADTERIFLEPKHMVNEAIKLLRPTLPTTIEILHHLETTDSIFADPTHIHQIVMNLCTNAFHAMEQTGGVLDITLKNCALSPHELQHSPDVKPGKFVMLSIADSGPGIPLAIQSRIFDPYFTTKEIGKGTGMGLAIVHGIVTTAGGFVTCESELGKGTVFKVFYPAIEQQHAALEIQPMASTPTGKERILFVDDEDILVEMGQVMLERLGYEVTVCTNSLVALKTFQDHPEQFDAVITDQTMPGMTGLDLARMMLQIRPDLPIILCTGYSNLVNEDQAKNSGVKEFAMKPVSKKDIATLLRKVLEERS
jgi:nitrogen-specific signal transduction histidine kinase/ActR/RegA family two-component response regulator